MNWRTVAANGAWLATSLPAWQRFRKALRSPAQIQQRILQRLLQQNAECAYGRRFGFAKIRDYETFRDQVAITSYEELEPWILRIMRGESGVLTTEPVTRLVPTGGSTGGRKLIPFTRSLQREFNAAIAPWMIDLSHQHPTLPFGPAYWSISPAIPVPTNDDSAVPIGFDDDSAYLGGFRRRLAEATFAVPSSLRTVSDFDQFRYLTLLCLLRAGDLRFISIWHPSFLTLLLDALPVHWDHLIEDVARGGCRFVDPLPTGVQRSLQAPAQPDRARELKRLGDPSRPHTIWPDLRLVSCWGDGQAALALDDLRSHLPGVSFQSKGLLATEAFISIPFAGQHPIAVTSHFFEFADSQENIWRAHELQKGKTYRVVVSTAGGLWRYQLGDLVEVDGFLERTPSLRFLGRGASVSDLCGEKLTEAFVTAAIRETWAALGLTASFVMLAPEQNPSGLWAYTLLLDTEPHPELGPQLDRRLRANPHYALCRDLDQIGPVQCFSVGTDARQIYLEICRARGQRLGDVKPRLLSSQAEWRQRFIDARRSAAEPREHGNQRGSGNP